MRVPALVIALAAAVALPVGARHATGGHSAMPAAGAASAATPDFADGEVRRIDMAAAKITLRHGEIRNLDMPPMTMVFAVRDPAWLERLRPGDKVRFRAVDDAGQITVTELEPAH